MRRILTLFSLLFLATACKQESPVAKEKQTILRLNFAAAPGSFNPRHATFSNAISMYAFLYDGLYRMGADRKPVASVAKSVDISPDGLHYTFHLKRTLWSNGDPLTAYDFEYAWKWMLTPTNPTLYASHLYVIKNGRAVHEEKMDAEWLGVYAKDSDTLVVELEEPCPYFLDLITLLSYYPLHRNNSEVINGPFLVDQYVQDSHLKLIKNPHYWDKDQVKIDGVDVTFVEDSNTELYIFERGELDWAGPPPNGGIPLDALGHLPNINQADTFAIFFYSFNVHHPLLKSNKVRRALSLSIDRHQIVKYITQGPDTPAYTFVLQENSPVIPSDEELQALFKEGWEEVGRPPLTFTLSHNQTELQSTMAQYVQPRWNKLFGLDVHLAVHEWKAYLHNIQNGLFDCTRASWRTIVNDPVALLELFEDPKHTMQHSNWSHPEFLEAMRAGRKTMDPLERAKILKRAVAIFNDEAPVTPLFYQNIAYVKNPKLKGEVINRMGLVDFKWAYFE